MYEEATLSDDHPINRSTPKWNQEQHKVIRPCTSLCSYFWQTILEEYEKNGLKH